MVNSPFLGGDFFLDHKSFKNQNYSKEQMSLLYLKKMFPNITRIVGLRSRKTIIEASKLL